MGLIGGTRLCGGQLPPDLNEKVGNLITEFEAQVTNVMVKRGIRQAVVRSHLPCNSIILLDRSYISIAAERAHGMPASHFVHEPEKDFSLQDVITGAILDLGYESPFVIRFPLELLNQSVDVRGKVLAARAEEWVSMELNRLNDQLNAVRLEPIFGQVKFLSDQKLCFVIMPFEDRLDQIYKDIVKPCVEEQNLVCRRADDIRGNTAIIHDIWKSICEARIVIADLTTENANVFYELGIAHTVGKQTILIGQKSDRKFPFDLMHLRRVIYEDTATGGQKLRTELRDTILNVLKPNILTTAEK